MTQTQVKDLLEASKHEILAIRKQHAPKRVPVFPESFVDKVKLLMKHFSKTEISKHLHISHSLLNKYEKMGLAKKTVKIKSVDFLQLPATPQIKENKPHLAIEFKINGLTISVYKEGPTC